MIPAIIVFLFSVFIILLQYDLMTPPRLRPSSSQSETSLRSRDSLLKAVCLPAARGSGFRRSTRSRFGRSQ